MPRRLGDKQDMALLLEGWHPLISSFLFSLHEKVFVVSNSQHKNKTQHLLAIIRNNWLCGVVGYHFCLTHRRSPVRARAKSYFFCSVFSFLSLSRKERNMI